MGIEITKTVDLTTVRAVKFSWKLTHGTKEVFASFGGDKSDTYDAALRKNQSSFYIWHDKKENCLYLKKAYLINHQNKTDCSTARWVFFGSIYKITQDKTTYIYSPYEVEEKNRWRKHSIGSFGTNRMQSAESLYKIFLEFLGKENLYDAGGLVTEKYIKDCEGACFIERFLTIKGRPIKKALKESFEKLMNEDIKDPIPNTPDSYILIDKVNNKMLSNDIIVREFHLGTETKRRIMSNAKFQLYIRTGEKTWRTANQNEHLIYYNTNIRINENIANTPEMKSKQKILEEITEMKQNKKIHYINLSQVIDNVFLDPNFEKFWKIAPDEWKKEVLDKHPWHNSFCVTNLNEQNIWKFLGINQWQLQQGTQDSLSFITFLKRTGMFKNSDISYIDNQTFSNLLSLYKTANNGYNGYNIFNLIPLVQKLNNFKVMNLIRLKKLLIMLESAKKGSQNNYGYAYYRLQAQFISLYGDYLRNLEQLFTWQSNGVKINLSNFEIWLDNEQDIKFAHDRSTELLNSVKREAEKIEFDSLKKHWKKYEFEDENYCITYPDSSIDIVEEGSALHHCVGGYVSAVKAGQTTILFLRDKKKPTKPWFTIEVRNNQIQQIHGLYNRWLSSTDEGYEAVPFVMRWLKKLKIGCSDQILLSTAQGYCGNNNLRPKPALT